MRTPRRPGIPLLGLRARAMLAVGVVAVGALALAGCASASPGAQPTPSASATPMATLDPAAVTAPAQVLGGDCSALFTDAEVSTILGIDVSAQTAFSDAPTANAVPTVGGVVCNWTQSGASEPALSAVLESTATVAAGADDITCYQSSVDPDGALAGSCSFGVTSGPLWLTGVVTTAAGTTEDDAKAAAATLSAAFGMLGATDPGGPAVESTAWPFSGCADLSERAALAVQSPNLVGSDSDIGGAGRPAGVMAALRSVGAFSCSWSTDGDVPVGQVSGFNLEALPGGAWAQTEVLALPGAEVVDLPGVDLAVRVPMDAATTGVAAALDVFDGGNWLQVSGPDDLDALAPAVTALVAALNAG
ncbi:hypothetical protein BJQ94_05490 [Cryobacterium sp. SO2]|uniref:hypothetical protein n=1 Tax=Cryobacterium sp. SO2 TaxID=1897060 RepID=UPI00223D3054|nr:hypothetical protein [Cryobacterium sp. SO2]WEO78490.1 hypothetical protein BJQ94_05490 [Cryobacterium sp. SO2]